MCLVAVTGSFYIECYFNFCYLCRVCLQHADYLYAPTVLSKSRRTGKIMQDEWLKQTFPFRVQKNAFQHGSSISSVVIHMKSFVCDRGNTLGYPDRNWSLVIPIRKFIELSFVWKTFSLLIDISVWAYLGYFRLTFQKSHFFKFSVSENLGL